MRPESTWRTRYALALGALVLGMVSAAVSAQGPPPAQAPPPILVAPMPPQSIHVVTSAPRPPKRLADVTMAEPADNPASEAKTALGRRLFFDPLLSNDRTVSCATCHDPERAFTDGRPLAIGVFGRTGKRHSPSLINRGFGQSQFWDGRAATLEAQVLQPISDPNEMDLALNVAVERLSAVESYRAAFQSVFDRALSSDDLGRALASYLRTIRSGDAPYDRFIDGQQDALTSEQQLGLQLFRTKARCTICHIEPTFSTERFENTGVAWRPDESGATGAYQDPGRFAVSSFDRDRGKFKVPTLREIARTGPYMHDGSLATLADVVDFYDRGGRPNPNLFPILRPLGLTAAEKQALIKFLESLNGTVTGK